jgi:predicted outer membrane protein
MADKDHAGLHLAIDALSPILTAFAILVGVWQFRVGLAASAKRDSQQMAAQDSLEFERRTWQDQLETYRQLATAAGKLAASTDDRQQFAKAVREFESVYWGVAIFIQDSTVGREFRALHDEIGDYRAGRVAPTRLKLRATSVTEAARVAVYRGWDRVRGST